MDSTPPPGGERETRSDSGTHTHTHAASWTALDTDTASPGGQSETFINIGKSNINHVALNRTHSYRDSHIHVSKIHPLLSGERNIIAQNQSLMYTFQVPKSAFSTY